MTRLVTAMAMVAILASACTKQEAVGGSSVPTTDGAAAISFKSEPATPTMGENAFEVMLMQNGNPVNDAQVTVEFQMPAMPQMNMAEMKTKTDLARTGEGLYTGKGQVMMAGNWNVTVMAMRGGQELATKKLTVTAK